MIDKNWMMDENWNDATRHAQREDIAWAVARGIHMAENDLVNAVRQGVDRAISGVFVALILWAIGFTVFYFLGKFLGWW
jgi:hypothetical protein